MEFRPNYTDYLLESTNGLRNDPLMVILLNFYSSKSLNSISDISSSVYDFPMIQREDFFAVFDMRQKDKSVTECSEILKKYFNFDPANLIIFFCLARNGGCIFFLIFKLNDFFQQIILPTQN